MNSLPVVLLLCIGICVSVQALPSLKKRGGGCRYGSLKIPEGMKIAPEGWDICECVNGGLQCSLKTRGKKASGCWFGRGEDKQQYDDGATWEAQVADNTAECECVGTRSSCTFVSRGNVDKRTGCWFGRGEEKQHYDDGATWEAEVGDNAAECECVGTKSSCTFVSRGNVDKRAEGCWYRKGAGEKQLVEEGTTDYVPEAGAFEGATCQCINHKLSCSFYSPGKRAEWM